MGISTTLLDHIYIKTPLGLKEIAERSSGLLAKQRRLLILIDGIKSSSDLAALLAEFELSAKLDELVELGFIQLKDTALSVEPNVEISNNAIKELPTAPATEIIINPIIDPIFLEQAKNLMIESAQHCLGIMARSIIEEIQQCNQSNYKVVIARWNMALRQSNKARTHADQYVDAVKTLIGID
ncbi:hypothetical protein ACFQNF_07225 [Iodobacter arcticus]|uniref:Uncharacterized protein n=1 Tax=Iodobacter arcticus TaxID=590593 RepID=A0ABW2R0Z4_9NEIS